MEVIGTAAAAEMALPAWAGTAAMAIAAEVRMEMATVLVLLGRASSGVAEMRGVCQAFRMAMRPPFKCQSPSPSTQEHCGIGEGKGSEMGLEEGRELAASSGEAGVLGGDWWKLADRELRGGGSV